MRYRRSHVSRYSGTEQKQPCHGHHRFEMMLDSSGTCDDERRMAVGNELGDCA